MKRKSMIVMVLLLLVCLTSGYVASTYAKYTSQLANISSTATVAKWDFKAGGNYGTFSIDLPASVDASTLVAGKIAPGTSGTFTIALDNSGSEVGVEYTIDFTGASNVPSNLVFTAKGSTVTIANGASIEGSIPAGETDTVTISWAWPYETGNSPYTTEDAEDTTYTMTLSATVNGIQTEPSATALPKTWSFHAAS